jgi:DNA-binding LytR/AlgR family response regulator
VRLSARPRHVRTLILNGEATAVRARDLTAEADPATTSGINLDFLYKPIDPPQFDPAVDNAIGTPVSHWAPQIIGEKAGRIFFLEARDVEYLEAAGNYVIAHVGANGFLARATLKCMSARLAPLGFVQIERSLLVNLRQVEYAERLERGQFCFVMRGGERLVSSRERSASLRALFLGATSP